MDWLSFIFGKQKSKEEFKYESEEETIISSTLKFSSHYNSCIVAKFYRGIGYFSILIDDKKTLSKKMDKLVLLTLEPCQVYASLYNRGINNLINNDSSRTLYSVLPSIDWQLENIKYVYNLSTKDRNTLGVYTGSGYKAFNRDLRNNKDYPVLNEVILNAPPLEHDIIVFRYVFVDNYKVPDINQIFPFHGYMSTTFSSSFAITCGNKNETMVLFRIKVPKNTRCLYIPQYEFELIFPHGSLLKITSVNKEKLICGWDCENKFEETVMLVYNVEMLEQTDDLIYKGIKRYPEWIRELRLPRK